MTESISLVQLLPEIAQEPVANTLVTGICQDSRLLKSGDLFCACIGLESQGHDYIKVAIQKGAAAIFYDAAVALDFTADIPLIAVEQLSKKLSFIAGRFYQHPSHKLKVIGITGTNGKTSSSYFLAQALTGLGSSTAVIGTLGNGFLEQLDKSTHTTPDAISVQALLANLYAQGAEVVVMEVSSHALMQERVAAIHFVQAALTNLTQDHLDYHGSMEAYAAAKAKLFNELEPEAVLLNTSDAFGHVLSDQVSEFTPVLSYATKDADISADNIVLQAEGIKADLNTPWGTCVLGAPLLGYFNLDNLLLVVASLGQLGFELEQISKQLTQIKSVPGRMQLLVATDNNPSVIVDYAHTPDALKKALLVARSHCLGSLSVVFGCGGNRDHSKRPIMARIASASADKVYITTDNPRAEDPLDIIQQIQAGIDTDVDLTIQADRAQAIAQSIAETGTKDVVLIAGKGHEDYQEINAERVYFSDIEQAKQALTRCD